MSEMIRKEHEYLTRKSNEKVVKIVPGRATVVEFTPSGSLIETYPLPYQGLVLITTAGAEEFVLIEATIDGDYVTVFKSFDELRKYVKDTYGLDIELE
jgi:hypothetical protein